jgi:NADPH:quinone reductase
MQAIRVNEHGGPEVLKLEEVSNPQVGPGQVLVRVKAAGVNPVDTYVRAGLHWYMRPTPFTPGIDAAGVVDAVGADVTKVKVGDRVYTSGSLSGSYAEFALCTSAQVHPLPERVSFAQGAGVFVPYGTAYRALFQRAQAKAAETVLVHGASGGVGTAGVQLARAAGLKVIGTAGSEKGGALVLAQGAHHVLNHHSPSYLEELMKLTAGRGVDVIMEMLANVNLAKDLSVLAKGGRVAVIGNRGTIEVNPRDTMRMESSIVGVTILSATEPENAAIHSAIAAGLENGTLRPIVREELPLAEAARAQALVMEPGALGKIVLVP